MRAPSTLQRMLLLHARAHRLCPVIKRPARPRQPPLHPNPTLSSPPQFSSARLAMGNCLNPASSRLGGCGAEMMTREEAESLSEMKRISQVLQEEEEEVHSEKEAAARTETAAAAAEGLKVKIVLTRAELEWLMAQLKSGDQRLEDVLHHMHAVKARAAADTKDAAGWRPRLESIIECPETAAY